VIPAPRAIDRAEVEPVGAPTPRPADAGSIPSSHPLNVRNAAMTVLAVAAVIGLLQYAQAVIIPIVLGVLISYGLEPAVTWLTTWRVPRHIGAAVVLTAVVARMGSLIYGL